MAKQQTVVKEKRNVKTYLKNSWQLYVMLIIPVVYMILFKYKPMLGVVVAFKKFNVFQGIWNSPWIGLANFCLLYTSKASPMISRSISSRRECTESAGPFL